LTIDQIACRYRCAGNATTKRNKQTRINGVVCRHPKRVQAHPLFIAYWLISFVAVGTMFLIAFRARMVALSTKVEGIEDDDNDDDDDDEDDGMPSLLDYYDSDDDESDDEYSDDEDEEEGDKKPAAKRDNKSSEKNPWIANHIQNSKLKLLQEAAVKNAYEKDGALGLFFCFPSRNRIESMRNWTSQREIAAKGEFQPQ
jgi:hypothetical protein